MDNQQGQQTNTAGTNTHAAGSGNFMHDLENIFDKYLNKQAPFKLPEEVKEFIVKFGPWVDLVVLVITLPVILAAFGIGLIILPFAVVFNPFHSLGGIIIWLISLASFVLEIVALPGLFKRAMSSWRLMYYASLVAAVGSLVRFDIVGLVLGLLVSMYFLFQIKDKYHN